MEWSEGMALAISVRDVNGADVGVIGDAVKNKTKKRGRGRPKVSTQPRCPGRRRGRPPASGWKQKQKQKLAPHDLRHPSGSGGYLSSPGPEEGQTTNLNGQTCNISTDRAPSSTTTSRYIFRSRGRKPTINDVSLTEVPISGTSHKKMTNLGSNDELNQHMAYALQYMVRDPKLKSSTTVEIDPNLAATLEAINKKHGVIMSECLLESDSMKTFVLLGICKVVQDLQKKELKDIDISELDSYYTVVRDAKSMKVNVDWLLERLDGIKDGVYLATKVKALVAEKKSLLEDIDCKKKELETRKVELDRLASEFERMEKELAREHVMVEELNGTIEAQKEKLFALPAHVLFGEARVN